MLRHLGQAVAAVADGHVTGEARERALAHLAVCPQCRVEVERHRAMRHRLAALAAPTLPDDITARLLGLSLRDPTQPMSLGLGPAQAQGSVSPELPPVARPATAAFHPRQGEDRTQRTGSSGRRRALAAGALAVAALSTGALIGDRAPRDGGGSGPAITPGSLELARFDTTTRTMVLDDQGPAIAVAANH